MKQIIGHPCQTLHKPGELLYSRPGPSGDIKCPVSSVVHPLIRQHGLVQRPFNEFIDWPVANRVIHNIPTRVVTSSLGGAVKRFLLIARMRVSFMCTKILVPRYRQRLRLNTVRELSDYGSDGLSMVGLPFAWPLLATQDSKTGLLHEAYSCMKGRSLQPLTYPSCNSSVTLWNGVARSHCALIFILSAACLTRRCVISKQRAPYANRYGLHTTSSGLFWRHSRWKRRSRPAPANT